MINMILIKIAILPVRFYQLVISPLTGPTCRYSPSCSQYMIEAIREWGVIKGWWMGMRRIASCHPWGKHGHDPVPKNPKKQSI